MTSPYYVGENMCKMLMNIQKKEPIHYIRSLINSCDAMCSDDDWNQCPIGDYPLRYIKKLEVRSLSWLLGFTKGLIEHFGEDVIDRAVKQCNPTLKQQYYFNYYKTGINEVKR